MALRNLSHQKLRPKAPAVCVKPSEFLQKHRLILCNWELIRNQCLRATKSEISKPELKIIMLDFTSSNKSLRNSNWTSKRMTRVAKWHQVNRNAAGRMMKCSTWADTLAPHRMTVRNHCCKKNVVMMLSVWNLNQLVKRALQAYLAAIKRCQSMVVRLAQLVRKVGNWNILKRLWQKQRNKLKNKMLWFKMPLKWDWTLRM